MIEFETLGTDSASSWARIFTFASDASQITRTVVILGTFWSAVWRVSNEFRQART
jgi:hypothetical protein